MARTRGIEIVKLDAGGAEARPASPALNLAPFQAMAVPTLRYVLCAGDARNSDYLTAHDVASLLLTRMFHICNFGGRRGLALTPDEFRALPPDCRTHFRPDTSGAWIGLDDDTPPQIADDDRVMVLEMSHPGLRSIEPHELLDTLLIAGHRFKRGGGELVVTLGEWVALPARVRALFREMEHP